MEASAEQTSLNSSYFRKFEGARRSSKSGQPVFSPSLRTNRTPCAKQYEIRHCSERKIATSEEKFWHAWNSHKEYLKKLSIVWMNISVSDAEDAFSEATIRAFEKYRSSPTEISNERAWFARLLHNICIDRHRANKRQKKLRDTIKEIDSLFYPTLENSVSTPEADFINGQLRADINAAIDNLPERLRLPLVMRLVQEEEYDNIAGKLGISNDNARKRVQQARAYLRSSLAQYRR